MKAMKFLIGLLAISAFALGATPALAAPPSNDTIAGATAISALPFSDTVNTTEATTDADDLAAAQPCVAIGAPAVEKAVWYKYTATANVTLVVDTSGSTYTTGVAAYNGAPSAATFVSCAPVSLTTSVTSGQTAYVMVFGAESGSPGGTLQLSVVAAPPPPEVSLSVDPVGSFDPKSGSATISGTATCSGVGDFAGVNGALTQTVGRFTISGFFFAPLTCDGVSHVWTAQVTSSNGKFGGGKATVQATAFGCGVLGCGQVSVTQQIHMRR